MTDYTKLSQKDWLTLARSYYCHLVVELKNISEAESKSTTSYLGWSCKDLINQMTSAITINFNYLIQMSLVGKPVPLPGFDLFQRNADEVWRRKESSIAETVNEFENEIFKILERFESMNEDQWLMPAFFFIGMVDIRTLFLVQFADNVVHERDIMSALHKWKSFNSAYAEPLLDWFMCAFRPAFFRPERADGTRAVIQYYITGNGGGNWFMEIKDNHCSVQQGNATEPEIKINTSVEELIDLALARSSIFSGKLARSVQWLVKKEKKEDFVAEFMGITAVISSVINRKVQISGDNRKARKIMKNMFWHFWQRKEQTEKNILTAKYRSRNN